MGRSLSSFLAAVQFPGSCPVSGQLFILLQTTFQALAKPGYVFLRKATWETGDGMKLERS